MGKDESEDVGMTLQSAYDEYYDDSLTGWRETGAKVKANNIESVCRGQSYEKVLECGAGEGSILKFLNKSDFCNELYALEISDSGIAQIKNRELGKLKEVQKFNGYVIPYPDDYFDLVYCSHVVGLAVPDAPPGRSPRERSRRRRKAVRYVSRRTGDGAASSTT